MSFFQRETFATGGGPSMRLPVETEQQVVFDGALAALGDTICPLFIIADSDTGYHDNEIVIEHVLVLDNASEIEVLRLYFNSNS